ncbi:MAG: SGNH/GDSL hydrolase family protein [Desulfatibacillaceae bacterium]
MLHSATGHQGAKIRPGRQVSPWRRVVAVLSVLAALGAAWCGVVGIGMDRPLPAETITHHQGKAWHAPLGVPWPLYAPGDDADGTVSEATLLENGEEIGTAHVPHGVIAAYGEGMYSHYRDGLWFSTPDGTDPTKNGRTYAVRQSVRLAPWATAFLLCLLVVVFEFAAPFRWSLGRFARGFAERTGRAIRRFRAPILAHGGPDWRGARKPARGFLLSLASLATLALALPRVQHFPMLVVLGGFSASLVYAMYHGQGLSRALAWRKAPSRNGYDNAALVFVSVFFALLLAEAGLYLLAGQSPEPETTIPSESPARTDLRRRGFLSREAEAVLESRRDLIVLPDEWKQKDVAVAGAAHAFLWHGVLHVADANHFRRTTPFPEKRDDTFRILAVGDSLTYGMGVKDCWVWPSLLEKVLSRQYQVEVLNLGSPGNTCADVRRVVERFVPRLSPDLVVYGVCLNDFLPSGTGQNRFKNAAVKVLVDVLDYASHRSRVFLLVSERVKGVLMRFELAPDYVAAALMDLSNMKEGFADEVLRINRSVTGAGLPPVVSMVLEQYPQWGGRGYRLALLARSLMEEAGMDVIPVEDFFRQYHGKGMQVSHWEGHPNEEAHAIFAMMIHDAVAGRPELEPYRIRPGSDQDQEPGPGVRGRAGRP